MILSKSKPWQFLCIASLAYSNHVDAWISPTKAPAISSKGASVTASTPKFSLFQNNGHDDTNNWLDSTIQTGRNLIATATMAAVIMGSPDAITSSQNQFWAPPAAYAASVLTDGSEPTAKVQGTVLDEAWTLVDKYYIDRSFNGQNWNEVYKKYSEKADKVGNDDSRVLKLVTEMVSSLGDKYSRILDQNQYAAIQKFDLIGVGVTLMPNENKEIIVGSPPVPKSASDLAGLKVGDRVVAINGISTVGRTAFDIIDQIAENPNAKTVTMTIQRDGETNEITMDRAFLEVKDPIRYKISETRSDGTKVGFVRILEFNALVKTKLEDALRNLEAEGANAYVIDLRMNTGGAFQSAVEIASLFMQDTVATYVKDSSGAEIPFKTPKSRLAIDKEDPIVLWLDGSSASASEVFAGALHDNCRAAVMGDKSFGKGLIQAVYGLKDGAGLVLTVASYVTPAGTEIQGIGITPDISGGVPLMIPGISTDTSKVDFKDIANRLSPAMCASPAFNDPA